MKAPDKIYMHQTTGKLLLNGTYHEYKPAKIRYDDKIIEYIRKDALLKWLDGKMTIEEATEGIVGGYDMALKDVIDHINKF